VIIGAGGLHVMPGSLGFTCRVSLFLKFPGIAVQVHRNAPFPITRYLFPQLFSIPASASLPNFNCSAAYAVTLCQTYARTTQCSNQHHTN